MGAAVMWVLLGLWLALAACDEAALPDVTLLSGMRLRAHITILGGLGAFCQGSAVASLHLETGHFAYLQALCDAHYRPHMARHNADSPLHVVVVGAGPGGLLSALRAYQMGATVTVLEKRTAYERNMWFDVSDGAWGDSLSVLQSWGLLHLLGQLDTDGTFSKMSFDDSAALATVLPLRCQMLERFLAQSALLLGIDVRYGVAYTGLSRSRSGVVTSTGQVMYFDVLVGADGYTQGRSALRSDMGIPEETLEGVKQVSLFARFAHCPVVAKHALKAWEVSVHVPEVVMVYRRFFSHQCDLQLLLTDEAAASLVDERSQWELLQRVVEHSVPDVSRSVVELKELIEDLERVETRIARAAESTVCLTEDCERIGVLVGDAVFPAHYRLGIGVNNIIDSMHNFGVFLSKVAAARSSTELPELVVEKQVVDEQRMQHIWAHQQHTMWLERSANTCGGGLLAHSCMHAVTVACTCSRRRAEWCSRTSKAADMTQSIEQPRTPTSCLRCGRIATAS